MHFIFILTMLTMYFDNLFVKLYTRNIKTNKMITAVLVLYFVLKLLKRSRHHGRN